ncbi:tetratricopeptide repeat-containing sensor histidine kinase [Aquimarina algiphila]|uniref:tetratricopeptide repeat-containing sensor histidine kinase n=1 Tax=Aquimarina algiphila TaxID=2047982 RepID=UPI002493B277|nr:ATP-binding protein [Aquimarina algiphila]
MHFYILRTIFIIILGLPFLVSSQQEERFTSFGVTPNPVNKRLYRNLHTTSDPISRIKIIDTIANIHIRYGNTDSIIYYGNFLKSEVVKYQKNIPNSDEYISKSYHILGKGKLSKGLYDDAMKYHLDGLSISPASTMSTLFYTHQLDLAIIYLHKEEYDTALPILHNCIEKTTDKKLNLLAKKALADLHLFKKEIGIAQSLYHEVLDQLDPGKDLKTQLKIRLNLGRINSITKEYDHAMDQFSFVKEKAIQNHFYDLYIDAVFQMGIIYYTLEQYDAAEMILNSAYVNTVQWNRLELQRDVINMLTSLYRGQEDYKNAYGLMTQYVNVSDQILKNQNKEIVKELEIKYQTLQKEKEIFTLKEEQLLKENEISRQRTIKNAFLIGFVITLIPIIALLILYFQKLKTQVKLNKSQEEVNQQKVHGLMKEQELNLIKASMQGQDRERKRVARELHDSIGGNLASIKLQLSNNDNGNQNTKIINQIDETYHQVRDISHDLASKKFLENGISKLVKEYISNIQDGSDQNISFNPHPEEQIDKIGVPLKEELFKIIQELLTNCLKHAQADRIDIYLNQYEKTLQLLFEDNGIGFNTKKNADGIGFKNIKKRLDKLSGTLFIDSTPNRGTVIDIEIPM